MLQWDTEYATGDKKIDDQHKEWFSFINVFIASNTQEELIATIIALYKYTKIHFAYEEKLMATIHYPQAVNHKAQHKEFLERLKNVGDLIHSKEIDKQQVDKLLQAWIRSHIPTEDKDLVTYLNYTLTHKHSI